MKRTAIESEFTIANGIIQTPGKFESEPTYAPALYDIIMDGGQDETITDPDESVYDVIIVDDEFRTEYADILSADTYAIVCHTRQSGFFDTCEYSRAEYDSWIAAMESADEDSEPTQPDEDDITTADHEKFYQSGRLVLSHASNGSWYRHDLKAFPAGVLIGDFGDDHIAALKAFMDKSQFWPNVWFISDHGNAHLMDLNG